MNFRFLTKLALIFLVLELLQSDDSPLDFTDRDGRLKQSLTACTSLHCSSLKMYSRTYLKATRGKRKHKKKQKTTKTKEMNPAY